MESPSAPPIDFLSSPMDLTLVVFVVKFGPRAVLAQKTLAEAAE